MGPNTTHENTGDDSVTMVVLFVAILTNQNTIHQSIFAHAFDGLAQ